MMTDATTRACFSQLLFPSLVLKRCSGHLGHWRLTASDTAGFYTLHRSLPKWPSKSLHRPGICATVKAREPQYMNRDYIVMWGHQCVRFLIKSQCQSSQLSACCRHSEGASLFFSVLFFLNQPWLPPVSVCFLHACLCLPTVRGVSHWQTCQPCFHPEPLVGSLFLLTPFLHLALSLCVSFKSSHTRLMSSLCVLRQTPGAACLDFPPF